MTINSKLQSIVIASGTTLSSDVGVANSRGVMIHFPVLTSCQVIIQGAYTEAASANYFPVANPVSGSCLGPAGGPLPILVGAGSVSMNLTPYVEALTAFRLNFSVAQAAPRSLAITQKF